MKNNASLVYFIFLVVGDFLALVAAFVGAYILRVTLDARPLIEAIPARTYLGVFLALLPFWIIIFGLLGLYNSNIYEKRFAEVGRLLVGSFLGLLFVIGYNFISTEPIFPARLVPLYGFLLAFIFLVLLRTLARFMRTMLFRFGVGITNILIIGNTSVAEELIESLASTRTTGYRIVAVVGNDHAAKYFPRIRPFKTFAEACKAIGSKQIHSIVQTELYAETVRNNEILDYAQTHHISYRFIPGNTELFVGNIDVELFHSSIPMIAVHQTPLFGWGQVIKRSFDFIVALAAIIVLSPLLLLVTLLMSIFDRGPIIFKQKRVTRFGSEFNIYKYRSHKNKYNGLTPEKAFEKMGHPELAQEFRANGDQLPNDPRLTWLGRFLRKTSLDELPQLFNILKGDISIVGPRALVAEEIGTAEAKHHILSVKSGLTGLAQVSGRKDLPVEERRKLDLYYIQNWTFWLDITIIIKTLRVLVTRG
jgi:exopolysaccharide biosynthesis polyprenyl glycosylphosphotransferase